MRHHKSDIPAEASEVLVSDYRQDGYHIDFQIRECVLNGQVVGRRAFDVDGSLRMETPLKNGKRHGREYTWDELGNLELIEPYFEGKIHGIAKQYGRHGKVIGTYRCVHGTGFDIWRYEREDGTTGISEIHSLQEGSPHGYEWWLTADQRSVWHERHWHQGLVHGIERMWNGKGRLKTGYPKYWIQGQVVAKRLYLKSARTDKTLPDYLEAENRPQRQFPAEIAKLLA